MVFPGIIVPRVVVIGVDVQGVVVPRVVFIGVVVQGVFFPRVVFIGVVVQGVFVSRGSCHRNSCPRWSCPTTILNRKYPPPLSPAIMREECCSQCLSPKEGGSGRLQ